MSPIRSVRTKKIMEHLAAGILNHSQIAREVGCSREYVRQCAERQYRTRVVFNAALLKTLRESKNWTLEQLGHKVGVAPSEIHRWESGEHVPRALRIQKLAKIFSIDKDRFTEVVAS